MRISHGARFTWTYDSTHKQWHSTHGSVYYERGEGWWLVPAKFSQHDHYGPYLSKATALEEAEKYLVQPEHDEVIWPAYA